MFPCTAGGSLVLFRVTQTSITVKLLEKNKMSVFVGAIPLEAGGIHFFCTVCHQGLSQINRRTANN